MPAAGKPLPARHALILGLLHGPAELLPVSSSAHVALVPWLLGWPYGRLDAELRKAFEVGLHAGTAAALLVGLRRGACEAGVGHAGRDAVVAALSLVPPAVLGYALERPIERRLGSPGPIAGGLLVGSALMAAADRRPARRRRGSQAGAVDALVLGLAQGVALAPGVSRHGATLAAARARGFGRADAEALSLRVGLPVIVGAAALKGLRLARRRRELPPGTAGRLALAISASFASTLGCGPVIARLGRGRPLLPYVGYRAALAAVVIRRLRKERAR
ncbi:MAG: undecaprenyl-diphosphate phosphatase [Actinobacteria bacterium]|nr:MAG: undecaprenyl-diphosphate phosphatase [Actinomycetota bacterium]